MPAALLSIDWLSSEDTGANVAVPQKAITLKVDYIDEAGDPRSWQGTRNFPNILTLMPTEVRNKFFKEMVTAIAAVELGIETWDSYR